jgi:hypothetical protein
LARQSALRKVFVLAILIGVASAIWGCSSEEADVEPPPVKIPVESGKVNPAIVGTWETEDKLSTFIFDKDGKFSLKTTGSVDTRSQSGTININGQSKGVWSEKDGKLMMRYEDGVEGIYDWKPTDGGKTMELKAKRSRKPSKYRRKA